MPGADEAPVAERPLSDDPGYCETCGKRITADDFGFGDAVRRGEKMYCIVCAQKISADTDELPALPDVPAEPAVKSRPPSTRVLPASRSRRRKKRHSSSRRMKRRRSPSSSATLPAQPRNAEVQAVAVSVLCPYCFEKLVVKVSGFPAEHTCQICDKTMRIPVPPHGSLGGG